MKKTISILVSMFVIAFNSEVAAQANQPYIADYSANFTISDQALSTKILEMWKDWDDNQFDRHDYMADTVEMTFADGTKLKGKMESMEAAKKHRGTFTKVVSTIHAWVPLKSTDRDQNLVCIWGKDESTTADGKVEKSDIHEVWFFNKDGKVVDMLQWKAKFGDE